MTEFPERLQDPLVFGIWGLDIIWNLGFGDWNLAQSAGWVDSSHPS